MRADDLLVRCFREPQQLKTLSLRQWDLIIRQARSGRLLGLLGAYADEQDLPENIQAVVGQHLQAAQVMTDRHRRSVSWEIECLQQATRHLPGPVILLKGAAYVAEDLPPARARLYADIDILVPEDQLKDTEQALKLHGWLSQKKGDYDQYYYRRWTHELPPMRHIQRGTVVDLHHRILPPAGTIDLPSDTLIAQSQPLPQAQGLYRLSDTDICLHSATHLFHEGEMDHGLRDLLDLDGLLRHFSKNKDFWPSLSERASALGLGRELYYALRYCREYLATPVPETTLTAVQRHAPWPGQSQLMDGIFHRVLAPLHHTLDDHGSAAARFTLFVRGHWLRMRPAILLRHMIGRQLKKRRS